jgi:hypothetical protein
MKYVIHNLHILHDNNENSHLQGITNLLHVRSWAKLWGNIYYKVNFNM